MPMGAFRNASATFGAKKARTFVNKGTLIGGVSDASAKSNEKGLEQMNLEIITFIIRSFG